MADDLLDFEEDDLELDDFELLELDDLDLDEELAPGIFLKTAVIVLFLFIVV